MIILEDQRADANIVNIAIWKPQNHPARMDEASTWKENTSAPAVAKTLEKPIPMNHASPTPASEPTIHPIRAAMEPSTIATYRKSERVYERSNRCILLLSNIDEHGDDGDDEENTGRNRRRTEDEKHG